MCYIGAEVTVFLCIAKIQHLILEYINTCGYIIHDFNVDSSLYVFLIIITYYLFYIFFIILWKLCCTKNKFE